MCVEIIHIRDEDYTEDVCEDCQKGDHETCNDKSYGYDDEHADPCACYNSEHTINDPQKFVEKFLEQARQGR